jgi:two-component system chemotaxis response regulator CheY
MKCLVVDDSAFTRRILVNSLESMGFTLILEAADGAQAMERCTPDVVLVVTDWNMPGMSGVELVRSLRAKPELASIPVLIVTARTTREDMLEAADAGVDAYVLKPFTPDVLRKRALEAMQRGGAGADSGSEPATGTGG